MSDRLPETPRRPRRAWSLLPPFALFAGTAAVAALLDMAGLPAAILMGGMVTGAALAASGRVSASVPIPLFVFGQAVIGCLIAANLSRAILLDIVRNLPVFLFLVLSVILLCAAAGWILARKGVVPGVTAIWGTSPGAALVMTVLSERYGADSRLVAFMQYLRVILVTASASAIAGIWAAPAAAPALHAAGGQRIPWPHYAGTAFLCLAITLWCLRGRRSSGVIFVSLVVGGAANVTGLLHPAVHPWLLAMANALVGWSIGLRFTRPTLVHAARILPWAAVTFVLLIAAGGGIGVLLGRYIGVDPLTAFLAAAPGGLDAMTIITASIGGDMSFVIAVQTTRFIVVMLMGPLLASFLSRTLDRTRD